MGPETKPGSVLIDDGEMDEYPPNGYGEIPPAFVPGARYINAPGLKSDRDFRRLIKAGPIRELIHSLHDQGKHVALKWSAGEITLFIAHHRKLLVTLTTLGGVAGAGIGTWYLTRRVRRRGRSDV